jgi:subtilisin family serine protease
MNPIVAATILKIAILDTGLDLNDIRFKDVLCSEGHKNYTSESISDVHGHGTHVTGLIKDYAGKENIGKYCLVIYKIYGNHNGSKAARMVSGVIETGDMNIVNISGGGKQPSDDEYNFIKTHPNVMYITAAGNEGENLADYPYYPASYNAPNIITVGAVDDNHFKLEASNFGKLGMVWELGKDVVSTGIMGYRMLSGTSMATAIYTGRYIKKLLRGKK